jgi:hypothetical protein
VHSVAQLGGADGGPSVRAPGFISHLGSDAGDNDETMNRSPSNDRNMSR